MSKNNHKKHKAKCDRCGIYAFLIPFVSKAVSMRLCRLCYVVCDTELLRKEV